MGKVEKVSVSLTGEMLSDVQHAVASGQYASTSEVVRHALRSWREQRDHRATAIAELKLLLAEAEQSGYVDGPIDFESIKAEGRKRLANQRE